MLRVARFLHGYATRPAAGVTEEEVTVPVGAEQVPATVFRPRRPGAHPGWVVLHGMTVPGRAHPALQRFARSLAGSGAVVLVPEVRAWRELRVDPEVTDEVIAASAHALATRDDVREGGAGVVGFSFGATQALITAARHGEDIRAVVAFGAYCDPVATFQFAFTGEFQHRGRARRVIPDPYGRWIVTANFLRDVEEFRGMDALAEGARALAMDAGRRGVYAGDGVYDKLKAELRDTLSTEERTLWEIIAPVAGQLGDLPRAREIGARVAAAAVAREPRLDPRPFLPQLRKYVVVAHGYHDALIPFTQTLELSSTLGPHCPHFTTISRLFAHSREAERPRLWEYPLEGLRYARLLNRALRG